MFGECECGHRYGQHADHKLACHECSCQMFNRSRTYSDDEYADALQAERWGRYVRSVTGTLGLYMAEVEARKPGTFTRHASYETCGDSVPDVRNGVPHSYDGKVRAKHPNHVYPAVYAPGGYIGGAGTEGG